MAVKRLVVRCDFCETEQEVEFDQGDVDGLDLFGFTPLPDEDWIHLERGEKEWDFCSFECMTSHLS